LQERKPFIRSATVSPEDQERTDPSQLKASLQPLSFPHRVFPGERFNVILQAENRGKTRWLSRNKAMYQGKIHNGYRQTKLEVKEWLNESGEVFPAEYAYMHQGINEDYLIGGFLPCDVSPGQSVELNVKGTAPNEPGRYQLCLDMYYQCYGLHCFGSQWFTPENGCILTLPIEVEARWPVPPSTQTEKTKDIP